MWLLATTQASMCRIRTEKSQHTLPIKGQVVNSSAFVDRVVSVATTQLCC